jgi:hypothetical protein
MYELIDVINFCYSLVLGILLNFIIIELFYYVWCVMSGLYIRSCLCIYVLWHVLHPVAPFSQKGIWWMNEWVWSSGLWHHTVYSSETLVFTCKTTCVTAWKTTMWKILSVKNLMDILVMMIIIKTTSCNWTSAYITAIMSYHYKPELMSLIPWSWHINPYYLYTALTFKWQWSWQSSENMFGIPAWGVNNVWINHPVQNLIVMCSVFILMKNSSKYVLPIMLPF